MRKMKVLLLTLCVGLSSWIGGLAQESAAPAADAQKKQRAKRPPRPGVSTPGVRREMSAIMPEAVFPTEGSPDWQVSTEDAEWVSSASQNAVHRLDAKTNAIAASITVGKRPCSGLAAGDGERVFAVPHHDDTAGDFVAVLLEDATTKLRAELDDGDVLDVDGSAVDFLDDGVLDVLGVLDPADAADEVLSVVLLDDALKEARHLIGAAARARRDDEFDRLRRFPGSLGRHR